MKGGVEMIGYRKFWMTIVTGIFALGGLGVLGWIFKDVPSNSVASQIYLIYCLTLTGGLTAFVTGNVLEHKKGK